VIAPGPEYKLRGTEAAFAEVWASAAADGTALLCRRQGPQGFAIKTSEENQCELRTPNRDHSVDSPLLPAIFSEIAEQLCATPTQVALAWRVQRSPDYPGDPRIVGKAVSIASISINLHEGEACPTEIGRRLP